MYTNKEIFLLIFSVIYILLVYNFLEKKKINNSLYLKCKNLKILSLDKIQMITNKYFDEIFININRDSIGYDSIGRLLDVKTKIPIITKKIRYKNNFNLNVFFSFEDVNNNTKHGVRNFNFNSIEDVKKQINTHLKKGNTFNAWYNKNNKKDIKFSKPLGFISNLIILFILYLILLFILQSLLTKNKKIIYENPLQKISKFIKDQFYPSYYL
tara:strand:- start:1913 stop:2548 length:636 start_codon:yes stop_codon:yes gene_type:complete